MDDLHEEDDKTLEDMLCTSLATISHNITEEPDMQENA